MKKVRTFIKVQTYRLYLLMAALFIAGLGIMPFMMTGTAQALPYGQIATRSLTLSSGVPGKTGVKYTFTFTLASTSDVQSLKFIACNAPAVFTYPGSTGSCVGPTGLDFSSAAFNAPSFSGWQGATQFVAGAGTVGSDCVAAANIICANRTDVTAQTATARTIAFTGITNPSTANTAFYVGIYTYSDNAYTVGDLVDFGATATAVAQTLETDAAVAEVLQFCVGSTTVDDVDNTLPGNLIANDCTGVSGTTVDIGTLDTSAVNVSPVLSDGGNSTNGVAMVRSNAGNGVGVYYDAIQASTGTNHLGALRITGQTCNTIGDPGADANGNTFTDPCINSEGWDAGTGNATQGTLTAGTEAFGMTIAGINSNGTSSYACQYGDTAATPSIPAGNNCHLEPQTNYLGSGGTGSEDYCQADACNTTGNGFAWDEDGTSTIIASSAAASVKQVDDEALIVKFAGTPEITTPFGRYIVKTDFTAVPTY
jgi:hypothetical protein